MPDFLKNLVVDFVCGRSTLCDPYLNLFRGLIPPIGGTLDLSPILALVVLDVSCPPPTPSFPHPCERFVGKHIRTLLKFESPGTHFALH